MIYYTVTKEDFLEVKFPCSKVLQNVYNSNKSFEALKSLIKSLRPKVLKNEITLEEVNQRIRNKVISLEYQYPEEFPPEGTLGSYSKYRLAEEFMKGNISVNGYTVQDMLVEKQAIIAALQDKAKAKEGKRLEEERDNLAKHTLSRLQRVPIEVGMLFVSKEGMARAFEDQYPAGIRLSAIVKELPNSISKEYGKFGIEYGYNRQCHIVRAIHIEGGMAYLEDIIGKVGATNAN